MKRERTGKPVPVLTDMSLPVRQMTKEIMSALAANDVLLLVADTGSGKTTQMPQMILESDPSAFVVVTQPRRVAAITVASRVAAERGAKLGGEVGYAVRFDDRSERGVTKIRYVTDGVLLREALTEGPSGLKKRYSHVIIDEVHERSVNTDLVLGVIKETLTTAPSNVALPTTGFAARNETFAKMIRSKLPFKVIIMSATTDTEKILAFFRDKTSLSAGLVQVPGRQFTVKVMYAIRTFNDPNRNAVSAVKVIHSTYSIPGDILIFMPGQEDIMEAIGILKQDLEQNRGVSPKGPKNLKIFPLYAALSPEDQLRAVEPLPEDERETTRKVIFSTNIAETSITIPNIVFVIDTGLVKVRSLVLFDEVFADVLRIQKVSKAQATQRKGRAGRTEDGVIYRLYAETDYNEFEEYPKPEILRLDATGTMLQIIALCATFRKNKSPKKSHLAKESAGALSFRSFPLLDSVPQHVLSKGLETLCLLGATNFQMELVGIGRMMARFPVGPMLSRSLLESLRLGCVDGMLSLAAVLSVEGAIFLSPPSRRDIARAAHRRFLSTHGDHLSRVNALNAFLHLNGVSQRVQFCRDHYLNYRALSSAESIRFQLRDIMTNGDIISWGLQNPLPANVAAVVEEAGMDELVLRCLAAGYFRNTAKRRDHDGKYRPIGTRDGTRVWDMQADIHPSSVLRATKTKQLPKLVIYDEFVSTAKPYLRTVTAVETEWLMQHSKLFQRL